MEINGILKKVNGILKETNGILKEINGILDEINGILKEIMVVGWIRYRLRPFNYARNYARGPVCSGVPGWKNSHPHD